MKSFMLAVCLICLAICFVGCCAFLFNWMEWCFCSDGKIEFERFKNMYAINPRPWLFNNFGPSYYVGGVSTSFRLSFTDTLRYIKWDWEMEKEIDAAAAEKRLRAVYAEWEKDAMRHDK